MTINVLYLGRLQDIAGREGSQFALEGKPLDWNEFVVRLDNEVNGEIAAAARHPTTKIAVNGVVQSDRDSLAFVDGDEVALLPPVSGG